MLHILPRYSGGLRGSCPSAIFVVGMLLSASATHAQVAHDHSPLTRSSATHTGSAAVTTATSPLRFESTLSRYKPMTDQKLGSWREANDTVTRIGGWRTYLKEAQTPDSKSITPVIVPDAAATPVAPTPHSGHGVKR